MPKNQTYVLKLSANELDILAYAVMQTKRHNGATMAQHANSSHIYQGARDRLTRLQDVAWKIDTCPLIDDA